VPRLRREDEHRVSATGIAPCKACRDAERGVLQPHEMNTRRATCSEQCAEERCTVSQQ
jgi:hypothetical protein